MDVMAIKESNQSGRVAEADDENNLIAEHFRQLAAQRYQSIESYLKYHDKPHEGSLWLIKGVHSVDGRYDSNSALYSALYSAVYRGGQFYAYEWKGDVPNPVCSALAVLQQDLIIDTHALQMIPVVNNEWLLSSGLKTTLAGLSIPSPTKYCDRLKRMAKALQFLPKMKEQWHQKVLEAERTRAAHKQVSLGEKKNIVYQTECGYLDHYTIDNTMDFSCVGHSLAYAAAGLDFMGTNLSLLLALSFISTTQAMESFIQTTFSGQGALSFSQSVQSFADFSGRPVFIWQWPKIIESESCRHMVIPYDAYAVNGALGRTGKENLILPHESFIQHGVADAVHLFLVKYASGGAHCEVLIHEDFKDGSRLCELNKETAWKLVELIPNNLERGGSEPNFLDYLQVLSLDVRLHLEIYIQSLVARHIKSQVSSLKTISAMLDALRASVPEVVQEIEDKAVQAIGNMIDFMKRNGCSKDKICRLLLWHDIGDKVTPGHFKWFSLVNNKETIKRFMQEIWQACVKTSLAVTGSGLFSMNDATEVVLGNDGVPLLVSDDSIKLFGKPEFLSNEKRVLFEFMSRTLNQGVKTNFTPVTSLVDEGLVHPASGPGLYCLAIPTPAVVVDEKDYKVNLQNAQLVRFFRSGCGCSEYVALQFSHLIESFCYIYKINVGFWTDAHSATSGLTGVSYGAWPALQIDFLVKKAEDEKILFRSLYSPIHAPVLPTDQRKEAFGVIKNLLPKSRYLLKDEEGNGVDCWPLNDVAVRIGKDNYFLLLVSYDWMTPGFYCIRALLAAESELLLLHKRRAAQFSPIADLSDYTNLLKYTDHLDPADPFIYVLPGSPVVVLFATGSNLGLSGARAFQAIDISTALDSCDNFSDGLKQALKDYFGLHGSPTGGAGAGAGAGTA